MLLVQHQLQCEESEAIRQDLWEGAKIQMYITYYVITIMFQMNHVQMTQLRIQGVLTWEGREYTTVTSVGRPRYYKTGEI